MVVVVPRADGGGDALVEEEDSAGDTRCRGCGGSRPDALPGGVRLRLVLLLLC